MADAATTTELVENSSELTRNDPLSGTDSAPVAMSRTTTLDSFARTRFNAFTRGCRSAGDAASNAACAEVAVVLTGARKYATFDPSIEKDAPNPGSSAATVGADAFSTRTIFVTRRRPTPVS